MLGHMWRMTDAYKGFYILPLTGKSWPAAV